MAIEGNKDRIVSYEWDEDYEDFINRFEEWVDIKSLKISDINDLYAELHNWLGITKRGKLLPTQPQMNLFSEYYGLENFPVSAYESEIHEKERQVSPQFGYTQGTIYNEGTREVEYRNTRTNKYEHYIGEEKMFKFKNRTVIVIRDSKTKRILAWHKDITNDRYLGQVL